MVAWPVRRMDELCEITSSKRIFAADYVSEGVPFYRGREITEKYKGNLDVSTELFITEEKFSEIQRKFGAPKSGDLLLTSVGTLGSVYVVKPGDRFYFKDGNLTWFRNFRELDSHLLYYWLGSPQGKAELQKCTIGSSQSAFTIVLLKGMEMELPPLPVQRRVAGILSAYDELIENNLRRIRILESMGRALYREWFVHLCFPGHEKLRRVASAPPRHPQGWQVRKLASVANVNRAQINARNAPEELHYIDISSVSPGQIDTITTYAFADAPGRARRIVQHGDVLWSCVRPNRRSHAQVMHPEPNTIASTGFAVLTASEIPFTFLYFATTTDDFVSYLANSATGATYPAVTTATFEKADLLIPSAPLLKKFGDVTIPMAEQIHTLQRRTQNLRRTRDLLLPRLLSGQVNLKESGAMNAP
jgi:type I restriction enzyme S subunit